MQDAIINLCWFNFMIKIFFLKKKIMKKLKKSSSASYKVAF